jgi:succinate dehydrogenase / fumarate reductase membrane anchor subunit
MSDLKIEMRRSFLGRARGFGSSNTGFTFWWMQRLTSIAMLPLTPWLVFNIASLAGKPVSAVEAWAGHPLNATLLIATLLVAFHHMHMGIQVVAEDYVHTDISRMILILFVKAASFLLCLAGIVAVLRMAVAG